MKLRGFCTAVQIDPAEFLPGVRSTHISGVQPSKREAAKDQHMN